MDSAMSGSMGDRKAARSALGALPCAHSNASVRMLVWSAFLSAALGLGCDDDDDVEQTQTSSLMPEPSSCLTECSPRVGIVSAFGAEADILLAETTGARTYVLNGNTFTTGTLGGVEVVIVLSGVSVVNVAMVTQLMLDHFGITQLLMSGIAGGLDPSNHVGDVIVPERWALPLEAYLSASSDVPAPCGNAGDLSCLGLRLADATSTPGSDYAGTGVFMRDTQVVTAQSGPPGEFKFSFEVDPEMLSVAMTIMPDLQRCGDADPSVCVTTQPELKVGGLGISGSMFIASPAYREYVNRTARARVVDMETAALAQVAYANDVPYLAFRSLSDLAGGGEEGDSVGAFFGSGLAEANEARVTIAFLEAWAEHD
jgi:adenosylhomocysteine nucleosidase